MDAPNSSRLPPLSLTLTTARQTPKTDFGHVLAAAARQVGRTGSAVVGGIIGTSPGLSAASSGVEAASTALRSPGVVQSAGTQPGAEGSLPAEKGDSWDLLQAQTLLNQENQQFSLSYLKLQDEMQRESREHNTVSNIMKVRHDSAKAAINNIR
jgi:hypothetical protein